MAIEHGYISGLCQVAGVNVTGATQWSLDDGVRQQVDTKSDGEIRETRTVIIPENATGSVQGRNLEISAAIGTTGALDIKASRRTGGVEAGSTVSVTAASSTITGVQRGTDIEGNTTVTVSFRVNSPDGIANGVSVGAS